MRQGRRLQSSHLPRTVLKPKVLIQPTQRPPHRRVEMVLDRVVSPSGKEFRDLFPFVSKQRMRIEKDGLISAAPGSLSDVRRQVVVPSTLPGKYLYRICFDERGVGHTARI